MDTYEVTITLQATYLIEAQNEESAKDIAYDYLIECEPDFKIKKISKNS